MGMMQVDKIYNTILVSQQREVIHIQLNRPKQNNSINAVMVNELLEVLENTKQNTKVKIIILSGNENQFCTGMDFEAVVHQKDEALMSQQPDQYYNLLQTISEIDKVVIAKVEGKVNAGGLGLVAASDIVIAGNQATFGLSEALFGLLPACVLPFLIQRVGPQKAKWLTLITHGITAERAYEIGLVDVVTDEISNQVRKNLLRLSRLETNTIQEIKSYTAKLWIIKDETKIVAVNKLQSLIESEVVQNNIKNFVEKGEYPWEK
ncbi:enoyl-CoA hydratase/isomerase [Flavobacterium sp. PL02]|uniref:enoyl-CoA hydratase/isomerase n=1 Tax=Flavobacterium sp. PL02 TaxID=3088354 RepID=UPI002B23E88E|nr:enoyl-CoA hydratase/isomerase [Flavobacterium sp. PL02]MEA9415801.1 enoyl-CoA hydratase/isomerase [Flavobacterium sp. PL02]